MQEKTNASELIKANELSFLKYILKLPNELVDIISSYIPNQVIIFLNKKIYIKKHNQIKKYIFKNQYENYIRAMVRRDNEFVFSFLIQENFERWLFFKNYAYKNTLYSNYIFFLLEYCIENESEKCKQIINKYIINAGLSKNQYKKNTYKNIRWKK